MLSIVGALYASWLSLAVRKRPGSARMFASNWLINMPPRKMSKLVSSASANHCVGVKSSTCPPIEGAASLSSRSPPMIITDWATGPELLISTKRMDSSYGKNAANRVEESYGDAKNLRLRYPLAALGFAFGLRSDILQKEPKKAAWLFDLLGKLGQEDDAYHATCLVLMEHADSEVPPEEPGDDVVDEGEPLAPGPEPDEGDVDLPAPLPKEAIVTAIGQLPKVSILHELTPDQLAPGRFLATMVSRISSGHAHRHA